MVLMPRRSAVQYVRSRSSLEVIWDWFAIYCLVAKKWWGIEEFNVLYPLLLA